MAAETAIARPKSRSIGPLTIAGALLAVIGFGAVLMLNATSHPAGPAAGPTEDVVVAARNINARATIVPDDLVLKKISSESVLPGSFQRLDQVKGLVPQVAIAKGQPLTSNLVAKSADAIPAGQTSFLPIPKGFVAMTIPTGEQQGVAGFIQAGDYIAIIAVGSRGSARTVFSNVHVLRVGPATPDVQPAPGGSTISAQKPAGVSTSLSVVLTQCQAEFMTWFVNNSTLKYTLESYQDYTPGDTAVDQTCPGVTSAHGVTTADIQRIYPGFAG